jgi:3-hydroxyisobutyrate dehydrogenase
MKKNRIAFLGLGIMGSGMARRLLSHGFPLTVFNRNPEKSRSFASEGAKVAASPAEAASQAEIVISMVADDHASRSMWLGETGALQTIVAGTVCVDCSTVTVGWARQLAAAAAAKQCEFLDAPVTGSRKQAAAGELNFIVGGPAATLEKVRPALAVMCKSILAAGPPGSGASLKLVNNFMCGAQVAALAEAMAMIERSGLDRAMALEFLTNGAAGSPLVKTVSARMTTPDYTPQFMTLLMAKDLNYALKEGAKFSVDLTMAAAAFAVFQKAIAAGHGEKDMASVVEPLRRN